MLKVVQCWDDGVEDDITLMKILRKYGAKATFNLNPALYKDEPDGWFSEKHNKTVRRLTKADLTDAYAGFTIANHSMTHLWPTKIELEQWRSEVFDARKELQDMFQQPVLGFVYPFGDYDDATADIVREAGHVYARTAKNATPCLPVQDPMKFHPDCHFLSDALEERYELAKKSEAQVFYFWGHSYELCTPQMWADMDTLIKKITDDPDAEWAELYELFT